MADAITRSPTRFSLALPNGTAFINYISAPGVLTFTHTETPPALREGGIGTKLVLGALDQVRAEGLKVRPLCGFVRHVIARHPEYADLVA